jgi:phosphoribosylformylglycinamidine synthase PurS subunit
VGGAWPTGTVPEVASFELLVEVRLRPAVADPQGATVERALPALGFEGVRHVRFGKAVRFEVEAPDEDAARAVAVDLATRLLGNPVIEDSEVLQCRPAPLHAAVAR